MAQRLLSALGAVTLALAACSPRARDVVPPSRDVRVTHEASATEGYEYVARRPHGVVALAEARHMNPGDAGAIVEHLADELERCAARLEAEGLLVEGALRVVAVAGPSGAPALNVRVAPGEDVAHNALLCILSPVRALSLPASGSGTPGIAIEATWGPRSAGPTPADGGDGS